VTKGKWAVTKGKGAVTKGVGAERKGMGGVRKGEWGGGEGKGDVTKGKGAVTKGKGAVTTGKGAVTKAFSPSVSNRLPQTIPVFPQFTTVTTAHGEIRSYFHRFGLTDDPMCPCEEEQTADCLILQCKKLRKQRSEMIRQVENTNCNWPTGNETLVNIYLQIFVKFVKSIDFTDLQ
jgi:hypothetical protein